VERSNIIYASRSSFWCALWAYSGDDNNGYTIVGAVRSQPCASPVHVL